MAPYGHHATMHFVGDHDGASGLGANDVMSQKQAIFHVDKVLIDPPIKMCQI